MFYSKTKFAMATAAFLLGFRRAKNDVIGTFNVSLLSPLSFIAEVINFFANLHKSLLTNTTNRKRD